MAFKPEIELKDFPCSFNLETGSRVSHQRLLHVRDNVRRDLGGNDCTQEETIRNLNLLSWALFRLNEKKEAQKINTEVLGMTSRLNITALGNLVFLSCGQGDKINGKKYFTELQNLEKNNKNYDILKYTAFAEQAYSYSRLGSVENYKLCIGLFKKCIDKCPEKYLWKFGLGLVNRRLTNYNLHCSSQDAMDANEITKECASLLFDVAENSDESRLRGLAYAQLVQLRQYNSQRQQDRIFKNKHIMTLLELALEDGRKNPAVLTMCGKSIKAIDIDRAIDLLRDSLKLQENAIAYHHLGISLLKKVDLMASGNFRSKPTYVRQLSFPVTSSIQQDNPKYYQTNGATSSIKQGNPRHYRADSAEVQTADVYQETENQDSGFCSTGTSSQCQQLSSQSVMAVSNNRKQAKSSNSNSTRDLLSGKFQNALPFHANRNIKQSTEHYSQGASHFCQAAVEKNEKGYWSKNRFSPSKQQKPILRHLKSEENTSYSLTSLEKFAKSPTKKLDKDNALVKEALENYEKSLEVSQEENVPARLSLGDLYMRLDQFSEALAHYNLIIDKPSENYLVSVITAYECAGKCLLKLSELSGECDAENLKTEAEMQFKKAVSLAADLATRNPLYANCAIKVWDAFRTLMADVEKIPLQKQRYKEKISLLELAKNKDIAKVIKEMLSQGLELDDIDICQKGLKCYLREGKFEDALTFLNIASVNSSLTQDEAWTCSEMLLTMRATTYIATSWTRLIKNSPHSRRVFQQMFQMKYGECAGMFSGEEEEEPEIKKLDVLILNDESNDSEEQPDDTTILARNLARVFKVIYGLDTAKNLERNVDYGCSTEEIQLVEMEKYSLVVLIVGDNDTEPYKRMLEATHVPNGPNVVVIISGSIKCCPKILSRNSSVNMTDAHWQQTNLLDNPPAQDLFTYEVADKRYISWILDVFFDKNIEAVLRLFCFLVDEDFEKQQAFFGNPSQLFSS